jgi:hypothetical protein
MHPGSDADKAAGTAPRRRMGWLLAITGLCLATALLGWWRLSRSTGTPYVPPPHSFDGRSEDLTHTQAR